MKTKTLVFSNISMSVILAALVVVVYAFTASSAFAATIPTVETTIRNTSNTNVTTAPIGTVVHANTSVSSSTGPTVLGTVDFSLYPNTTCSGIASVQAGVLLATGVADSSTTTVGSSGLSYKVTFNGQSDVYATTTGPCVSLSPTSSNVSVNSTLSSTTVVQGTNVYQNSTLSGVTANATGTVAYGIYTNNACTLGKIDAGSKTVANAVVPQSNSVQMNTVGTLYFQAQYSGDQFNTGANGPCQAFSVISGSTTPPPPVPVGSGTLAGVSFNDLNKNKTKDSGEAGIAGFTVRLYGGTFWWNWGRPRAVATTTTDVNGNYSFTGLADGLYRVEETKLKGWAQISPDYKWVLLLNGKSVTELNFANISVASGANATTTKPRIDDDHKNRGQEKKQEKMEQKEIKKEAQKQKKINKLFDRINKLRGNGNDNDRDD
ncbi:MAG: subtilisin-like serine protease [Parcubacteria group bacterium Gr01-1014_46]|nr:MAG: subtilisin-like serine protease [Parcubacteria group bacterium Gr01-1014_46]